MFPKLLTTVMSSLSFGSCEKNIVLFYKVPHTVEGGAVASWLARSTPERAVWVRALAGDIVLCSWARHSHSASLHPGV